MKPLDERLFKDRFVGLISWAEQEPKTGYPLVWPECTFTFSSQMTVVDQLNLYGMGDRVNPAPPT